MAGEEAEVISIMVQTSSQVISGAGTLVTAIARALGAVLRAGAPVAGKAAKGGASLAGKLGKKMTARIDGLGSLGIIKYSKLKANAEARNQKLKSLALTKAQYVDGDLVKLRDAALKAGIGFAVQNTGKEGNLLLMFEAQDQDILYSHLENILKDLNIDLEKLEQGIPRDGKGEYPESFAYDGMSFKKEADGWYHHHPEDNPKVDIAVTKVPGENEPFVGAYKIKDGDKVVHGYEPTNLSRKDQPLEDAILVAKGEYEKYLKEPIRQQAVAALEKNESAKEAHAEVMRESPLATQSADVQDSAKSKHTTSSAEVSHKPVASASRLQGNMAKAKSIAEHEAKHMKPKAQKAAKPAPKPAVKR